MDGMLALCAAIGTDNAGVLFDAWRCYTAHTTLDDLRKLSKEDVRYVHINDAPEGIEINDRVDNVRALPGETGVIPLPDMLLILNDIGYDGLVTPEPFSKKLSDMAPEEAARTAIEMCDKVLREAGLAYSVQSAKEHQGLSHNVTRPQGKSRNTQTEFFIYGTVAGNDLQSRTFRHSRRSGNPDPCLF